jgi:hypothetical protein
MDVLTLQDDEEKELHRLSRFYWKEAVRCEQARAYLAGCVMLGAALETLLILMVNCFPEEAAASGQLPKRNRKAKPLLDWDLGELLRVAKTAAWLPAALALGDQWSRKIARVGDYAEVVRMVRNLAHPARYRKDHFRGRVTQKYLQRQFEVVLLCRDWLLDRNNKALLEHMKEEGLRQQQPILPVLGTQSTLSAPGSLRGWVTR